ncbi:MAG TPA: energy transducer TonB, partial [Novosphingobium sp.]|nr:energy transducer TonB [Novosphingobium sp.]
GAFEQTASLSQSDMDALRLNVESCWNVGILSTEALNVVITIGFEMTPDARPIESSIRQVTASGGSAGAQQAAFDAGRQAIVSCGINGYGLPQDLYDQWRNVEITFNPARMSNR